MADPSDMNKAMIADLAKIVAAHGSPRLKQSWRDLDSLSPIEQQEAISDAVQLARRLPQRDEPALETTALRERVSQWQVTKTVDFRRHR